MLNTEQLQQFRHDGYLVFERLIFGERLEHYLSVFDELVEQGRRLQEPAPHFSLELNADGSPRAGLLHKVQGVCVVEPRILELAREPAIVERVATLLEHEQLDVFGTKFFPKLAGGGTSTPSGRKPRLFLLWPSMQMLFCMHLAHAHTRAHAHTHVSHTPTMPGPFRP